MCLKKSNGQGLKQWTKFFQFPFCFSEYILLLLTSESLFKLWQKLR